MMSKLGTNSLAKFVPLCYHIVVVKFRFIWRYIMKSAILLILVILATAFQNVVKKVYGNKTEGRGTYIFSSLVCVAAAVFFALTDSDGLSFSAELIPYSIVFAVGYAAITVFSVLALRAGSLALSSLIISYSLMVPALFGMIYYHEPTSWTLYVGIALLLVSLALVNKEDGEITISLKWIIYIALAFLGNGLCLVVMQIQTVDFAGELSNEFMIIGLAIVAVAMAIVSVLFELKEIAPCLKKAGLLPVLNGAANGLANFLTLALLVIMPASLMQPLNSAGGIIVTVAISIFIYREKLSVYQLIGVLLGTASVVFLSL